MSETFEEYENGKIIKKFKNKNTECVLIQTKIKDKNVCLLGERANGKSLGADYVELLKSQECKNKCNLYSECSMLKTDIKNQHLNNLIKINNKENKCTKAVTK